MLMIIVLGLGAAVAVAGIVVALTGVGLLPGLLLVLAGVAIALVGGGLVQAFEIYRSFREWRELFRDGGPDEMRLVSAKPPDGFLIRRDAKLTFEVRKGGQTKQVERGIPVPIPQAFLWRVLGRVPLPIGRLTDERKLNLALRRSRKAAEKKHYTTAA